MNWGLKVEVALGVVFGVWVCLVATIAADYYFSDTHYYTCHTTDNQKSQGYAQHMTGPRHDQYGAYVFIDLQGEPQVIIGSCTVTRLPSNLSREIRRNQP